MRDLAKWSKQLRESLRNSEDLKAYAASSLSDDDAKVKQREIVRLAQLIAEVELGLTLLREIAPEEPAASVSALLSGYRFPVEALLNDANWLLVKKARFYLLRRKGNQWERSLCEYISIPEILRIFSLTDISEVPQLIPSSTYPRRLQLYQQTLSATPQHKKRQTQLAKPGYWYAKISHKGNSPAEVPVNIPQAVANLAPAPQVSLHPRRTKNNPSHTVTLEELLISAQEMDCKLAESGYSPENYHSRLRGIALRLYDASTDDFSPGSELKLEQLVHIVGLLNVGKSTLLEVLIYHLAKQGYRCALIVNDVVAQVRLASLFWHGMGISAAPVLGSERSQHLEKIYEPILATMGEDIAQGAIHPAWRWFSFVCPLLALVQSEDKWEFGAEPCHNLYQKVTVNQKEKAIDSEDLEDWEERDTEDKYTCPFYYKCPRHQLERDIAQSFVWVLTTASFIHTRVPRQGFDENLTFAEAVYRECHFLFVDEADRVQVQFDEAFAPDEVLVDASGNSLLNKLGIKFANAIYNSDRRSMAAELVAAAKKAHDYAQMAADIILPKLHNQSELVEWLGSTPFTGRSVFARIIRDILEPPPETENSEPKTKLTRKERSQQRRNRIEAGLPPFEERQRRKQVMQTIENFLQAPLNRRQGGELSDIAFTLLSAESETLALAEVANWLNRWLESLGISIADKTKLGEVARHLYFAILVAVLSNRLAFLVDHLSALMKSRVIDLHDTSLSLVYRPPHDYLPVLPSAPVGNILGFKYTPDRSSRGGKLEYFRYVGVGRDLLLNFPTIFAVDDWEGPHTVLISGTSYAPGAPAYHIRKRPTVLLEPASNNHQAGDAGIGESEFFFTPQQNAVGNDIALSGLPPAARKKAAEEMVKAICNRPGQAQSFLDRLFETLTDKGQQDQQRWDARKRLLLIANSYDEAAQVESVLKPIYPVENIDGIKVLRRDNAPADLSGIRRGKIRDLNKLPTEIVIAPLMALERGHNILNDNRIAAFGAAVFLSRPMPVPDDWQTTVQQLNNWALKNCSNFALYEPIGRRGDTLTLANVHSEFYRYAVDKMLDLNCRAMSFKQLTDDERSVLCWTQLVSIWQIIGRLVRGGVPCIVHFLDVKFAPKSAQGELDSVVTSLLAGIIKELQDSVEGEGKPPCDSTLARSLYGAFLNALKETKELHYDI
ncbi:MULTISPECIES: pPIWI_RE_Z domain-containing protein [unclassified Microcoleus]|uniref:pPIWI_RE_Z domain-containing protein n=1 Tax=unclassified Microcoleus TaxID=2642155 RepID=UPI002FD0317D